MICPNCKTQDVEDYLPLKMARNSSLILTVIYTNDYEM